MRLKINLCFLFPVKRNDVSSDDNSANDARASKKNDESDDSTSRMSTISEEFDNVAFENRAYKSIPFPGFPDSTSGQNYENVVTGSSAATAAAVVGDSFYENVLNLSNYENVVVDNLEAADNGKVVKQVPEPVSTYQNVLFQRPGSNDDELFYQNVSFARQNNADKSERNNNCLTRDPVDFPDYENYDFEEESVYQNMIVTENKKLVPASSSQLEAQVWPRLPSWTICLDHIKWNFL